MENHQHRRMGDDMINPCCEHSGVCTDMKNVKKAVDDIWRAINQMRTWVVLGMGTLIVGVGGSVASSMFKHFFP